MAAVEESQGYNESHPHAGTAPVSLSLLPFPLAARTEAIPPLQGISPSRTLHQNPGRTSCQVRPSLKDVRQLIQTLLSQEAMGWEEGVMTHILIS